MILGTDTIRIYRSSSNRLQTKIKKSVLLHLRPHPSRFYCLAPIKKYFAVKARIKAYATVTGDLKVAWSAEPTIKTMQSKSLQQPFHLSRSFGWPQITTTGLNSCFIYMSSINTTVGIVSSSNSFVASPFIKVDFPLFCNPTIDSSSLGFK